MSDIALQAVSLLSQAFADLAIVGSDKANFRPKLTERMVLAYLLNPANVTNNVTQFGDAWTTAGKAFQAWGTIAAGGAGAFGQLQLSNPAGSGKDLMIDSIMTQPNTVSATVQLKFGAGVIAAGGFSFSSKDYLGAPGAPSAVFGAVANAAPGGTIATLTAVRGLQPIVPPIRIPPGGTFTLVDPVANEIFQAGIEWREQAHV